MKYILTFLLLLSVGITGKSEAAWEDYQELFAEVSLLADVDVSELATIAAIESSFRPTVKAKTSSATGLFQFTDRTWKVTLASYGEKYGLSQDTPRTDAFANALMGAEYLKENRRVLSKRLKRYPSLADVYLAHLIAPHRVAAIERVNQNSSMVYLYPGLAKYNKTLFYSKDGTERTVKQFKGYLAGKVWKAYHTYKESATMAVATFKKQQQELLFAKATEFIGSEWLCSKYEVVRILKGDIKDYVLNNIKIELQLTKSVSINSLDGTPTEETSTDSKLYVSRRLLV